MIIYVNKITITVCTLFIFILSNAVSLYAADSAVILQYHRFGEADYPSTNIKINQFEAKKENKLYPSGTIALIKDVVFNPEKTLLDQVTLYLKLLLDKDISRDMSDLLSEKNIINVVNLTDDEKIKFLRYNNDKKNEFLNRKIKFMLILLRQEKKVEQNFYLN